MRTVVEGDVAMAAEAAFSAVVDGVDDVAVGVAEVSDGIVGDVAVAVAGDDEASPAEATVVDDDIVAAVVESA